MLLTVSFISIFLGACLQSSIGIGFSIIAVPSIIFLFGIDIAIPLLLTLNFIVSLFSIDYRNILKRDKLIIYAIFGCSIGVILGIWLYGSLSEKQILTLISVLMLSGVLTVLTDIQLKISPWVFSVLFFVIGVSAVWTAVPGPLMAFALLASGKSADEVSVSIQPLALIVYGLSLLSKYIGRCTKQSHCGILFGYTDITSIRNDKGVLFVETTRYQTTKSSNFVLFQ